MASRSEPLKKQVDLLYHGRSARARAFRYTLLGFDIAWIAFFVWTTMADPAWWIYGLDILIGIVILADFLARLWIEPNRRAYFAEFTTWADIIVMATLFLAPFIANLLFLRVIRAFRLLRSYHVLRDLRQDFAFFKNNEQVIVSVVNLMLFIFLVSALVFITQSSGNPQITHYIDALYFTVATLTTTGFGDITLKGTGGRLMAVLIMVIGFALFLRLVQTIFRPTKVKFRCPDCGLKLHDPDAVHCKHCGRLLNIETEGSG